VSKRAVLCSIGAAVLLAAALLIGSVSDSRTRVPAARGLSQPDGGCGSGGKNGETERVPLPGRAPDGFRGESPRRAVAVGELVLLGQSRLGGRVLAESGTGVESGFVELELHGRGLTRSALRPEGRFSLFPPPPDASEDWTRFGSLRVRSEGFGEVRFSPDDRNPTQALPADWWGRPDLVLVVRGMPPREYHVVWEDGVAAGGLVVVPRAGRERWSEYARVTDSDGLLRFESRDQLPDRASELGFSWARAAPPFWTVSLADIRGGEIRIPKARMRISGSLVQGNGRPFPAAIVALRSPEAERLVRTDENGDFEVDGIEPANSPDVEVEFGGRRHRCRRDPDSSDEKPLWIAPVSGGPTARLVFQDPPRREGPVILRFVGTVNGASFTLSRDAPEALFPLDPGRPHRIDGQWEFEDAPGSDVRFEFTLTSEAFPQTIVVPLVTGAGDGGGAAPLLLRLRVRYSDGTVPRGIQLHRHESRNRGPPARPPVQLVSLTAEAAIPGFEPVRPLSSTPQGFAAWVSRPAAPMYLRVSAPFMQETYGPFSPGALGPELSLDLALPPFETPVGVLLDASDRPVAHRALYAVRAGVDALSSVRALGSAFTWTNEAGEWALPRSSPVPADLYLVVDSHDEAGSVRYLQLIATEVEAAVPVGIHRIRMRRE